MAFCSQCGNPLPEGANFCAQCGSGPGRPVGIATYPAPVGVPLALRRYRIGSYEFPFALLIMAIGGIIMALRQDVALSSMIGVILPFMAMIIGLMLRRAMPLFRSMQVKVDRVNQVMREKLSGI